MNHLLSAKDERRDRRIKIRAIVSYAILAFTLAVALGVSVGHLQHTILERLSQLCKF